MATRSIADPRDRLTTILIAPMLTCSARLPVYAVIIAAFIPNRNVGWHIGLQGWCCSSSMSPASSARWRWQWCCAPRSPRAPPAASSWSCPNTSCPAPRTWAIGLLQRAWIFIHRAGTIIFTVTVVLWLLLNFPRAAPAGPDRCLGGGHLANGLAVVVKPIGFNRDIALP